MTENEQLDDIMRPGQTLPNATAVLVLGIISIVSCCFYGIPGFVCGIIALVLAKKDMLLFRASPSAYTRGSYNNLKAGRVCAIIGIILSAIMLLYVIVILAYFGASLTDYNEIFRDR